MYMMDKTPGRAHEYVTDKLRELGWSDQEIAEASKDISDLIALSYHSGKTMDQVVAGLNWGRPQRALLTSLQLRKKNAR